MAHIQATIKEALQSVLPIAVIVFILSISLAPLDAGVLVMFLFGTFLLIIGMSFLWLVLKFRWNRSAKGLVFRSVRRNKH